MAFAGWFELILAVLKFPAALLEVARLFQKTPEEKHAEIVAQVKAWMDKSSSEERPTWEHP